MTDFDFGIGLNQLNNYYFLCKKLSEVNINFDKISSSSIERIVCDSIQYGTTFIVSTTNPCIFWYKYESKAIGSGGNHMIVNGKKFNVIDFIKMNKDDLIKLIDKIN